MVLVRFSHKKCSVRIRKTSRFGLEIPGSVPIDVAIGNCQNVEWFVALTDSRNAVQSSGLWLGDCRAVTRLTCKAAQLRRNAKVM